MRPTPRAKSATRISVSSSPPDFSIVEAIELPDGLETVRRLFREYEEDLGVDLCFQGFAEELAALPGKYSAPEGTLVLVRAGEQVVGCGAVRPHGPGTCELKRMYIQPEARGKGYGRLLAVALLEWSKHAGYEKALLDTLARLKPAVALYHSLGFVEIPQYNENPEDDVLYFELPLRP